MKFDKRIITIAIFIIVGALLLYLALIARAKEIHYIETNGECQINDSEHVCTPGTHCVLFNDESDNGKCEPLPTSVPSVTPEPSATPTPIECKGDCQEVTPSPVPSITPEPTIEQGGQQPAGGAPPEWSNKCFYLKDDPDCKTKTQVFPGEDNQAGVHK